MTKLPRNVSGQEVIKALQKLEYYPVRQRVLMLFSEAQTGKIITIPLHRSLKPGLLRAILREVGISVKVFINLLEDP